MLIPATPFNRLNRITATLALAGAAVLFPHANHAAAQGTRIAVTSQIADGGPSTSRISKTSVNKYADLLKLNAEQREAAMALHEGYDAAYTEANQVRRKSLEEARSTIEEEGLPGPEFFEKMGAAQKTFNESTASLEASFLRDLKSLLSEQEAQEAWPAFERLRRREVQLRNGTVSGEGVDLVEAVAALKLAPSIAQLPPDINAAVTEYELEMDRKLEAKEKAAADAKPMDFSSGPPDMEKLQAQMASSKAMAISIKDVNTRHARKIGDLLPEDRRSEFEQAVRQRAFPRVYRPSKSRRALDAALGLSDLDASQRATLQEALTRYNTDAGPANEAWSKAIADHEETGAGGAMSSIGGATVRFSMDDEPEALVEARKTRRELDKRLRDSIDKVLSPDQREKVTKATDEASKESHEEGEGVMMDAVQIRRGGPG